MHDREKPEPPYSDRHGLEERVERALRSSRSAADVEMLARNVLTELASVVPIVQAALYVIDSEETTGPESRGSRRRPEPRLRMAASYAGTGDVGKSFALGEGLVGECARERRKLSVSDVPAEHFRIRSGLGVSAPRQLTFVPVSGANPVAAVLELATFEPLQPRDERFIARLAEGLAPIFHDRLPSFRRDQASRSSGPSLGSRHGSASEASRYRPELFARMGHELRTPLNSLLVLSQMLAENTDKNLTPKQMAFAQAINASGNELLALINEILELAKIESNALSVEPAEMTLEHLREHLELSFRQVAAQKGVAFRVDMRGALPAAIVTDPRRLQQILRNLVSNALELTEKGAVSLSVSPARFGWSSDHALLNQAQAVIAFGVSRSGGSSPSGERNAFGDVFGDAREGAQPALAHLHCTVSREVARLLGGELRVGAPDAGSTVTLYLPAVYDAPKVSVSAAALEESPDIGEKSPRVALPVASNGAEPEPAPAQARLMRTEDRVILTVAGDAGLEEALFRSAGARGYRSVTTTNIMSEMAAPTKALPAAVLLDLRAKDLEGWIVLDQLRQDPATRHIPVAVLVASEHALKARRMGAAVVLEQASPARVDAALTELELYAAERERRVLFVQLGAAPADKEILSLITAEGVDVRVTHSPEEGLAALRTERFHACIWSFDAAERGDLSSLDALPPLEQTPIIVYTGRPLKPEAALQLRKCSSTLMLKSAASAERLLHELSLHLYRPEAAYSSSQRHVLAKAARHPPELAGLRVLLIDADVRNVFAMTSALERHGALVSYADNVQGGLSLIDGEPSIAAVLSDAGLALENDHELLRHLRHARHPALPFIALASEPSATEQEGCLGAGASHYAAKPIAARRLISRLRVACADGAERGLVVCR
jgi:signal transduction histidine kinase/CheY-like chemotaxis protein